MKNFSTSYIPKTKILAEDQISFKRNDKIKIKRKKSEVGPDFYKFIMNEQEKQYLDQQSLKQRNCLYIFSLETGITSIIYFDTLILIFCIFTSQISYIQSDSQNKKASFLLLNIVTDYIMLLLYFYKSYNGIVHLFGCLFPGRMDEEFILDDKLGDLKWKNRLLCKQRKSLRQFYMASIIFQRFTFIESISLICIFTEKIVILVKILTIILYTLIQYFYTHKKILEMLEQYGYFIMKNYYQIHQKQQEQLNQQKELQKDIILDSQNSFISEDYYKDQKIEPNNKFQTQQIIKEPQSFNFTIQEQEKGPNEMISFEDLDA